jgi:hypothetical protein
MSNDPIVVVEGGLFVGRGYLVLGIGSEVCESVRAAIRNLPSGGAALRTSLLDARANELLPASSNFRRRDHDLTRQESMMQEIGEDRCHPHPHPAGEKRWPQSQDSLRTCKSVWHFGQSFCQGLSSSRLARCSFRISTFFAALKSSTRGASACSWAHCGWTPFKE